jgi:hypothetical protein
VGNGERLFFVNLIQLLYSMVKVLYGEEEEEMMASSPLGSDVRTIWDDKNVGFLKNITKDENELPLQNKILVIHKRLLLMLSVNEDIYFLFR